MQIFTDIQALDGRYVVCIKTQRLSEHEEEMIAQFGEPTVDIGGTFQGSMLRPGDTAPGTGIAFMLPSDIRGIVAGFPVQQVFDLADSPDSDLRAKLWADTVAGLIIAAKTALMAKAAAFVGQTIVTI